MSIRFRLTVMNFLEFFVWGAWLISLGAYTANTLHFTGVQIASLYGTLAIASLIMPALLGIVADRWVNAERLMGLCHLAGAACLLWASTTTDYRTLYVAMLLNSLVFVPTISLNNTVSYAVLEERGFDIIRDFPPIRVWGTIGFIIAMWCVDLLGWTQNPAQFYVSAAAGVALGLYCFTLPPCPPAGAGQGKSLASALGLDALVLFKRSTMVVFLIFGMFLGAALQITNIFGAPFLDDFRVAYPDSFGVQHPNILLSISQISETLFILTIPFFLRTFGIKRVMLLSIFAWVLRFGLFAVGNPGPGLALLVLSMIVYGMAFDFFNISGSLFIEREVTPSIRASAQGLFMLMTNGIGAFFGSLLSGMVVDAFTQDGVKDWRSIWFTFAAYALVLGLIFPFAFRYRHEPAREQAPAH